MSKINFPSYPSHNDEIFQNSTRFRYDSNLQYWKNITSPPNSVDSAAVISLIDSDYVQLRQASTTPGTNGLDSALTIALIDSDYIQLRQSNTGSGGLDSASIISLIDSNYVGLRSFDGAFSSLSGTPTTISGYGITDAFDGAFSSLTGTPTTISGYGITDAFDSASAILLIDSNYVQARQSSTTPGTNGLDSALTIALIDSAYVQLRQASTTPGTNGLDSALTIALIDSAYIQLRQSDTGSGGLDSSSVISLIDSNYIQLRQSNTGSGGLDSSSVISLIDSNYVGLRSFDGAFGSLTGTPTTIAGYGITDAFDGAFSSLTGTPTTVSGYGITDVTSTITDSDLDMGGNKVLFGNVYSALSDLPSASTYHGMFAHVHATGKGYFAHAGNWVELANASEIFDGDYASLTNTPTILDSANVISFIDSSYVQIRQITVDPGLDSSAVTSLIDSDYVQLRQSSTGSITITAGDNIVVASSGSDFTISTDSDPTFGIVTATDFNSTSDLSLKDNITTITGALDMISDMRGVSFVWKETGLPSVGVIAQEMEQIVPEVVRTNEKSHKTVNYSALVGVLIEAVKDLQKRVEYLENK